VTMPTFTDGVVVHQASLNALSTGINNIFLLMTGVVAPRTYVPTATAKINTPHLTANTTDTVITFDQAGVNNDNIWTAGQQAFTIQTGGVYLAMAQANFTANNTGVRTCGILLNGTSVAANSVARGSQKSPSATDLATFNAMTAPMSLAPGATLYFTCWQSSGGNLNLDNTLSGAFMSVIRIGN
jgi:hypothetical protein